MITLDDFDKVGTAYHAGMHEEEGAGITIEGFVGSVWDGRGHLFRIDVSYIGGVYGNSTHIAYHTLRYLTASEIPFVIRALRDVFGDKYERPIK